MTRSHPDTTQGLLRDPPTRLAEHNRGCCTHTAKYGPWSLDVVIEFADERRALAFERYLKSGSGVAFAHRHLRQSLATLPADGNHVPTGLIFDTAAMSPAILERRENRRPAGEPQMKRVMYCRMDKTVVVANASG